MADKPGMYAYEAADPALRLDQVQIEAPPAKDVPDTRKPATEVPPEPEGAAASGTTAQGEPIFCSDQGCWVAGTPAGTTEKGEPIFCNESGCWIGLPEGVEMPPPPVVLPDGRSLDANLEMNPEPPMRGTVTPTKPKKVAQGLFAPAVRGAKALMGDKELNKLRAEVIAQHSKVISAFVETSDSGFGQIVLQRMFEAADKDGNGTLDREEIRDALHALGFTFIKDKQLNVIMDRADADNNDVIDFEEFCKETPKTLRSSLIKLAKQNGHDLGFLA